MALGHHGCVAWMAVSQSNDVDYCRRISPGCPAVRGICLRYRSTRPVEDSGYANREDIRTGDVPRFDASKFSGTEA